MMRLILTGTLLSLAIFFSWVFYERYWRWRECIETAASSCVTPGGDNLTAGGMIWGVFAVIFYVLAVLFSRKWGKSKQRIKQDKT